MLSYFEYCICCYSNNVGFTSIKDLKYYLSKNVYLLKKNHFDLNDFYYNNEKVAPGSKSILIYLKNVYRDLSPSSFK